VSAPPVGTIRRLIYGTSLGKPYPDAQVEVVGRPRSGNYKSQGQYVRIGTVVRVRFLGAHECPQECSYNHEIMARLDQLQ
jgi:hypothetical protein